MFTWFLKLSVRKQGALAWLAAMIVIFILGAITHDSRALVWIYGLSIYGAYEFGKYVKEGRNG